MTDQSLFNAQRTSLREAVANELLAHGSFSSTGHGGENALVAADAVIAIIAQVERTPTWECMGRKQALPEPSECNWPDCGCDPHATKVIESLVEQGWTPPPDPQFAADARCTCGGDADQPASHHDISCPVAIIKGDRCTCGGDPDQPADHHDISCPLAVSSAQEKTP